MLRFFSCVVFPTLYNPIIQTLRFQIVSKTVSVVYIQTAECAKPCPIKDGINFGCGNHTFVEISPFLFITVE